LSGDGATCLDLDLQIASSSPDLPSPAAFERWAIAALDGHRSAATLTVRIVGATEGAILNGAYRGVPKATNVLSFPFELPSGVDPTDPITDLLGDVVICADVVQREAREQGKDPEAHWAHMVVHGVLHLLGYDHITDPDVLEMEGLETAILEALGFPTPYEDR
jgi:probable rRNA maturation factor